MQIQQPSEKEKKKVAVWVSKALSGSARLNAISYKRASSRDFGRPAEHAPRISARPRSVRPKISGPLILTVGILCGIHRYASAILSH